MVEATPACGMFLSADKSVIAVVHKRTGID
jgi:hypothetical protein